MDATSSTRFPHYTGDRGQRLDEIQQQEEQRGWTNAARKTRDEGQRCTFYHAATLLTPGPSETGYTPCNDARTRIHAATAVTVFVRSTNARTYFVALTGGRVYSGYAEGWGYDRLAAAMHGVPVFLGYVTNKPDATPIAIFGDHCTGGMKGGGRNAEAFGLVLG